MKHKVILCSAARSALVTALTAVCVCAMLLSSCAKSEQAKKETLTMVFLPNESTSARQDARQAFKDILEKASGLQVEIKTTTDYNIALESLISGKADIAYIGAEGYITAHKRNPAVIPLATNSGPSGTLSDAKYYSFIAVRAEDEALYKTENGYDLNKMQGKIASFVTASSTSGFTIPASLIIKQFGIADADELIQTKKVFSKVLFAGSHQGSQVNLYRKDADIAAFAIPRTTGVYDLLEGEAYQTGAKYRVAEGAVAPFSEFVGSEMTVIQSIPVLNAPISVNSSTVPMELCKKIQEALISDETANNPGIFEIKGAPQKGMYPKYTKKTKLIPTDDAWYDEIRKLAQ